MSMLACRYKIIRVGDTMEEPVVHCVVLFEEETSAIKLIIYEWFDGSKRGVATKSGSLMRDVGFADGQLIMTGDMWGERT